MLKPIILDDPGETDNSNVLAPANPIRSAFQEFLRARYQVSLPLLVEQPRRPEFGELAFPFCFELAKTLKRPPRKIAEEVVKAMPAIEGVERLEPAGGGYINVFFDRSAYLAGLVRGERDETAAGEAKIVVEHTNINPNKAAHIGHLRNAALGDTLVRTLRGRGRRSKCRTTLTTRASRSLTWSSDSGTWSGRQPRT